MLTAEIAELMQCFTQTRVMNQKFPKLSERVAQFKDSEEGVKEMCAIVESYVEKRANESNTEGIKEGMEIGRAKEIIRLSKKYHIPDMDIQTELSETLRISEETAEKYMEMFAEAD